MKTYQFDYSNQHPLVHVPGGCRNRIPLRYYLKHRIRWYTRWFTKKQFSFIYMYIVAFTSSVFTHFMHVWGWYQ